MSRTFALAAACAAAFAAVAAMGIAWAGGSRRGRRAAARELRLRLKIWEGEGGRLAGPPATAADAR